ncbi:DUF1345 domain-containing protein [Ornithinimicrobium sp. Y1847]|uniref:DUF1345 domain-containing protein n=1 Tax=Ornithinimicrobium sp. Y1847 TaxID=3405419 RepID=UPI003B683601
MPEVRRGLLAAGIGFLLSLMVGLLVRAAPDQDSFDLLFVTIAGYLWAYVVLTVQTFRHAPWRIVERWAQRTERAPWWVQLVAPTRPGPGVAVAVAFLAVTVGLFYLPQQVRVGEGTLGEPWMIGLSVVLIVGAWLTMATTYAVAYLLADVRSGYRGLEFPGEGPRSAVDYAYLSMATSTTFGTTDVQVRTSAVRLLVAGHGALAFLFNTVVLAGVVSVLVSLG